MKSNWLRHLTLALAFSGVVFASVAAEQNLFVDATAPAGGDGSAARPFRSPVEACDAVRKATRGATFVTVRVRPGDYFLADGLSLGASDSRLRFVGEKGVRFTRAEKATPGGVVQCAAPRPPDYETYFRMAPHAPMFFYDGKWAVEARWPNEGWTEFTKEQVVDSGLRSGCCAGIAPDKPTVPGSFRFANDRPANWDFGAGVYLAGYTTHDWAFDRVRLESFTPSTRLVRLAAAVQYGLCGQTWSDHKGRRFYIYGAKSELDVPGEYFYDRKSGRVDFIAPKGMKEFLAVTREGAIVSVKGASDVTFEGITFEYACGDAFQLENATNVVIRDSLVRNVGGNGAVIRGGRACRIERTEIVACGFGGVRVSGGDRRTLTRCDHVIADCEIHDFSRICRTYQPAAYVKGCGVTVRGCRIHDAPHSGVIYHGNEFLFEDNEVWDILVECGDAGAFYTGRDPTSRGNVLRGNYVHDVGHPEKGSTNTMGFYLDDCDAGDTVVSNRVVNVPRGVMIGGGHDNHLVGNVFERCNLAISVDARGVLWTDHWDSPTDKSWQMTRKVKELPVGEEPWKSRYPLLVDYLKDRPREPRHISIVGNRFVDCKKTWEWGMGAEKYLESVERRGNVDIRHAKNGVVWLDISEDVPRQTVIAEGGWTLPEGYQGHPTTVLTREGKLLCVWTFGHGGPCGPAAESTDGGRTWTRMDARFPAVYRETHKNCPTLQKCVRKDGGERLFVFSAKFKGDPNAPTNFFRLASMISDDGGRSWREGKVAGVSAAMPPTGFMRLRDGSLALFGQVRLDAAVKTDRPQDDQGVWMSVSRDDGETWGPMRVVAAAKDRNLCEPCCVRSPDGKTLALVMRENRHRDCSMMCFSSDEGKTWTAPVLTVPELSGDRHEALALEGGRYLICFRDRMIGAPTYGQYVGWVGSWDDLVHAKPGEMRIRLLNHHGKKGVWPGNEIDTGYSGVERLSDGTILCTTYTKHFPDDRHSSVVATRLYPSDGVLRRKEMRFKKVFAFSDIGDDAFAAKLAELNVFAAGCGGKPGSKEHAEQLARAKRFGIVPYVSNCGLGAKAPHRQTLSPEEAYRRCELAGEFLPEDLRGAARGEALNALWRKQHYRWGGEPENGNFEVYFEGMGGCFVGLKARAAGVDEIVRRLKAEPEAKAVCLDYIGYGNYHGCYHPHCLHLLKAWLGEKGLSDTQANRDQFFEDELVAYYNSLYDAVKAHDASVVVYAHLYPVFKPNPLFGNRLKLDYCGQTCAWYSRWPDEKVKKYAETVVRGQHDHWPFAHAAPFIAYGPWAGEIDPDFKKTPEDVERELRTCLEAGAEYLAVHEIKSVIDDPAVFAVFKKYCGKSENNQ